MNQFTKTEYDWKAAYTHVVTKLKDGDMDTDKFVTSLAGRLSVNAFIDDEPSDIGLATLFFDRADCLTYSTFKSLAPKKQEELMITLMQIKFAISLVWGFDKADRVFIDWQDGNHDT
jgi:hypothetical protein